jgi:hypothetical protein
LDQFKILLTNNAVLIYIDKTIRMQDLDLKDFTVQIGALPPPVSGDIVLNALGGLTELIGGILVLKFVVDLGSIIKQGIWPAAAINEGALEDVELDNLLDLSQDALDAGVVSEADAASAASLEQSSVEVTEQVIQGVTSKALAATGIGIFLAVGIDVIFGAINGSKEASELDNLLSDLEAKMTIVQGYLNTVVSKSADITQKSVDQITLFKKVATGMQDLLPPGHGPTFDFSFPATIDSLDQCLAAQQAALSQFTLLSQLRTTYVDAFDNNRNPTKASVVGAVLLSAPAWVTETLLNAIWDDVLAKYSTLLKNAT